jgi:hypothetical protein
MTDLEISILLDTARSALADIAYSEDMDLETIRKKAKRIYEATVPEDIKTDPGWVKQTFTSHADGTAKIVITGKLEDVRRYVFK